MDESSEEERIANGSKRRKTNDSANIDVYDKKSVVE